MHLRSRCRNPLSQYLQPPLQKTPPPITCRTQKNGFSPLYLVSSSVLIKCLNPGGCVTKLNTMSWWITVVNRVQRSRLYKPIDGVGHHMVNSSIKSFKQPPVRYYLQPPSHSYHHHQQQPSTISYCHQPPNKHITYAKNNAASYLL